MEHCVVLVRHGDDVPRAEIDPPLSPLGRGQAEALAAGLSGCSFDALYCSPRRRTWETAATLGARLRLRPIVDVRLREVPTGPGAFIALARLACFAWQMRQAGQVLVVTHSGPLRFLLLCLDGWRRLPWLWRQVPLCQPFVCRRRCADLTGPLLLLALGLTLGLILTRGPWPGRLTLASYLFAFATYWLVSSLAAKGRAISIVAALAILALVAVPLAFGPSALQNRKVTAFNAWAYHLGAHLPPLLPTAPHPNGVAGALAVALGLVGGTELHQCGRRRWLAALGLLLIGGALVLTASRAGWLAGAAAVVMLAASRGRRRAIVVLLLCGLAVVMLVAMAGQPGPGQPALHSAESLALRFEQWKRTLTLLRERPVTGLGLAHFPLAYAEAVAGTESRAFKTPNSALLELWADAGLLGLVAWAWSAWRAYAILGYLAQQPNGAHSGIVSGLRAGLVAFALHGFFETNTAFVWLAGASYGHLASPLPFVLLGLLDGLSKSVRSGGMRL